MTDLTGATDYAALVAAKATFDGLSNTDPQKRAAWKTVFNLTKSCVKELGGDCSMLDNVNINF